MFEVYCTQALSQVSIYSDLGFTAVCFIRLNKITGHALFLLTVFSFCLYCCSTNQSICCPDFSMHESPGWPLKLFYDFDEVSFTVDAFMTVNLEEWCPNPRTLICHMLFWRSEGVQRNDYLLPSTHILVIAALIWYQSHISQLISCQIFTSA